MGFWQFIQEQLLGMKWLYDLLANLLRSAGLDTTSVWGESLHFFIYDVIKITILLCALIFIISYIQSYFPAERTKKIVSNFRGLGANTVAALLGTVTPFCSCSSIPLFIGFTGAGLPLGVTFSFLISSPMVDLGSLILLTGVFGFKIAAVYVGLGLLVAICGGYVIEKLKMEEETEEIIRKAIDLGTAGDADAPELSRKDRLDFAKEQMLETFKKVFPYILLGVGIGALIHSRIPQSFVEGVLGHENPFGVVIATVIGVPMYSDIFGTIPVAEALLSKGASLGTVLSFMMGVTTLSLPSLIMLRKAIKPKLLLTFILICVIGIIMTGYFFNAFQGVLI